MHEGRTSNCHALNLARNSVYLLNGRHMWLLDTPDTSIVPHNIE